MCTNLVFHKTKKTTVSQHEKAMFQVKQFISQLTECDNELKQKKVGSVTTITFMQA